MLGAAFSAIAAAAEGCDAIVAYGRTHFAAWSAARKLGIRCYVYAIFSPVALPSRAQWDLDVQRTNAQLARRSAFTGRRSGCPLTTPATTSSPAGRG
jgi:cytosine/adenosine deaminase-related metal-dependent hydrolase